MYQFLKIFFLVLLPCFLKAQVHYSYAPENKDLILEQVFIEQVISGKIDPNSLNDKSYSALQLSINRGYTDKFKSLVELPGIDLNLPNSFGIRPVHMTVFSNKLEMLKSLHEKGADMEAVDKHGYNLLHFASLKSRPEFAHYLMSHFPALSMSKNNIGIIPLMLAIQKKNYEMVKILSKFKDVVNLKLENGFNSFLIAVYYESLSYTDSEDRRIGISKLIFPYLNNINEQNRLGDTAAHLASRGKNLYLIDFLLDNKADFSIRNEKGQSAFDELKEHMKKDSHFKLDLAPMMSRIQIQKGSFLKRLNFLNPFKRQLRAKVRR